MQDQRDFGSKKFGNWAILPVMPKATDDSDYSGTKLRLQIVRQFVAGDNQSKFAADLGISPNRWNNFERGSPLSKEIAFRLVRKIPGLTLDWLYLGIEDGLPTRLQRELTTVGNDLISAAGAGSGAAKKRTTRSRA